MRTEPAILDALAARAVAGDDAAREALVEGLLPEVRNVVRFLVRGDDLVDDLSQDVLVTVLRRLPTFRGEARITTWVHAITVRVTLHGMRKRRRDAARRGEASEADLSTAGAQDPYLRRRRAVALLDELPESQRVPLVLHHVLGMTVPEVAEELGVPVETVRTRLRRGAAKLRALESAVVGSPNTKRKVRHAR